MVNITCSKSSFLDLTCKTSIRMFPNHGQAHTPLQTNRAWLILAGIFTGFEHQSTYSTGSSSFRSESTVLSKIPPGYPNYQIVKIDISFAVALYLSSATSFSKPKHVTSVFFREINTFVLKPIISDSADITRPVWRLRLDRIRPRI